jgi:hypothetical protein
MYTNGTPWKGGNVDWHRGIIGSDGVLLEGAQAAYNGVPADGNQNMYGTRWGSGFGVLKMLADAPSTGMTEFGGVDFSIFRFAEVLLNLAEASFELNKVDEALDAINQIRNRAGVAPKTSIARNDIRNERKVELIFEGHRYWDVRRWRTAVDELSKVRSGLRYVLDYDTRKYDLRVYDFDSPANPPRFPERQYYHPITLNRTGQNPNLVENPGYN